MFQPYSGLGLILSLPPWARGTVGFNDDLSFKDFEISIIFAMSRHCHFFNVQFPNYKSQINSKSQFQMTKTILFKIVILVIGICLLFGAWILVLILSLLWHPRDV